MKLEDIGFYTLEDKRAQHVSVDSPLWRCELILTDRCNFKCPYCRGSDLSVADMSPTRAQTILELWCEEGLRNVRFSGGEPTMWENLNNLVFEANYRGVERVAISSNGSASLDEYKALMDLGVNDFSISLDACCASTGDIMSGRKGIWNIVIDTIRYLSETTYVTVGIVLTESNIVEASKTIEMAYDLGVSDIRIISAAQWNNMKMLSALEIPCHILEKCEELECSEL